jgi:hypothetical protein
MAAKIFNAPLIGEVGAIDVVSVAKEHARDMVLAFIVGCVKVKIEITPER